MAENLSLRAGAERQRLEISGGKAGTRLELGTVLPVPVSDYRQLKNKPRINGVELDGNLTLDRLCAEGGSFFPEGIEIVIGGLDADSIGGEDG